MYRNDDPFMPWNDITKDNPFAPHNNIMDRDDPFAPWNNPLSTKRDTENYLRRNHYSEGAIKDYLR